MSYKINGKSGKEADDILASDEVIHNVSVEMVNEKKDPNAPIRLLPLELDPTLFPSLVRKMERANATQGSLSFENCGNLGGYNLKIQITHPSHYENHKWRLRLQNWLIKMNIIPG